MGITLIETVLVGDSLHIIDAQQSKTYISDLVCYSEAVGHKQWDARLN